jgi:hypothetical protein
MTNLKLSLGEVPFVSAADPPSPDRFSGAGADFRVTGAASGSGFGFDRALIAE